MHSEDSQVRGGNCLTPNIIDWRKRKLPNIITKVGNKIAWVVSFKHRPSGKIVATVSWSKEVESLIRAKDPLFVNVTEVNWVDEQVKRVILLKSCSGTWENEQGGQRQVQRGEGARGAARCGGEIQDDAKDAVVRKVPNIKRAVTDQEGAVEHWVWIIDVEEEQGDWSHAVQEGDWDYWAVADDISCESYYIWVDIGWGTWWEDVTAVISH